MKKNLATILVVIISVFAIATVIYAANTFPTTLNSWEDGDVIESDWGNTLESKIGVTGSTITSSLDYRISHAASLSHADTITANWVNTANPWADNEVADDLTVNWTGLTSYPTGCTNQFVTAVGDTLTCASVDISSMTNLTVSATGLELSGDAIALTTNYIIPLTASTSAWESFRDTPSGRITDGDHLTWSTNTLNVDDDFLLNTGDTATGLVVFSVGASVSTNFEVGGYASISQYLGKGITGAGDCNDATDKFLYDSATGLFTCGTLTVADTQLTAGTDLTLTTNDLTLDSTLTQAFSFTNTGSQSMTGSLTVSKGLTANSYQGGGLAACLAATKVLRFNSGQFSCGTLADADIPDNITITNLSGTNTGDVSLGGTPNYLTLANQVLTLTKLDISDDTNATGGTGITLSANDFSFNSTEVEATTWGTGGNASNLWTFNLSAGDPTLTWTQSGASVSLNFEVLGYASASKYFGSGLTDCDTAATSKLLWSDTGVFSCGTDTAGSGSGTNSNIPFITFGNTASLSYERALAVTSPFTLTDGGVNSTLTVGFTSDSWDFEEFKDAMVLDANTTITGGNYSLTFDHASVSSNFEAVGFASASHFYGPLTGAVTGNASTATLATNVDNICSTVVLIGSNLTTKRQFTILPSDANYTLSSVSVTASGSNALGWNLVTGSATVPTSNVFTANKSASGSAVVTYTAFADADIDNGEKFDIKIASTSAALNSVTIRYCRNRD